MGVREGYRPDSGDKRITLGLYMKAVQNISALASPPAMFLWQR